MIGLFLVTHGSLGESLIQCACHVLNKRPLQIAQLGVNASELPASAGMVADDPVTEYQAAIESGDKKKQAEIYATHKQALFAHARKNLSNG